MTLDEIKNAVNQGKVVCWSHSGYRVIVDSIGQWFIQFQHGTKHAIGLTWADGVTLNGKESEFFVLMGYNKKT